MTAGKEEDARRSCKLYDHLQHVKDPRKRERCTHLLYDMLVLTVLAVICGADSFVMVETFGREKEEFLRTFLKLAGGIPSHDTLSRVFSRLNPEGLQRCLISWSQALRESIPQAPEPIPSEVVALDGKTLRRSFDKAAKKAALHLVSAFATTHGLVLGQVGSLAKKNEVAAIRTLLELLDIQGSIVTIDAAGTQKSIAKQILERGADFVLALKANHKTLHTQVITRFKRLREGVQAPFLPFVHAIHHEVDKAHGRIEERRMIAMDVTEWVTRKSHGAWAGLVRSIVCVESTRTIKGKVSTEKRFYLSSVSYDAVERIAHAIRSHWGIENQLHWVLDMTFDQDRLRARKDHAPENFAILQSLALNILRQHPDPKTSLKQRRAKAGWNDRYLLDVLGLHVQ